MALAKASSRHGLTKHFDTSAADTTLVLTTAAPPKRQSQRLLWISVVYSATPVQTGVIIEIDSGLGAGFDILLLTGAANVEQTFFNLGLVPLLLDENDQIKVTAPEGGGVITATIVVAIQEIL